MFNVNFNFNDQIIFNVQRDHFQCSDSSLFSFMSMLTSDSFLCLLLIVYSQYAKNSRNR